MDKNVDLLEKEIELKNKEIEDLKNRISFLENQILNKNRKMFGKSSEKIDSNQLNFFDEPESNLNAKTKEPTVEEITYKRNKPSKNNANQDKFSDLDVVEIYHELENIKCDICNADMEIIGKKTKDILKYEPEKMYIERHIIPSYACKNCEQTTGETNIITAEAPKTLISKSMASNELLAHIITSKYQYALPLYRQEAYFKNLGVCLSRQTMSNWIIACANKLDVIYEKFRERLLKSNYVQADETPVTVLDSKLKESKAKKYMWLYKTGELENQVILYDYQKTRSSSCPEKFLKGFEGYLQTDGYVGYNKLVKENKNIKHINCMAHIRRKFYEAIAPILKNEEALKNSKAAIGFNYCEEIYKLEQEIKNQHLEDKDFYQKRYEIRQEKLKPLLEEFSNFVKDELENSLQSNATGKALKYANNCLPNMDKILEDGSLEIDNNAAERAIKPFVIGRKNWLFSNTSRGAKASATLYSIIETAKANNLVAERYLKYLFDKLTGIDDISTIEIENLMPWSLDLPKDIKNPSK